MHTHTRMSRAKEIEAKQQLQAKLQLSFNNNTSKVLSWLGNQESTEQCKDLTDSKSAFFQLPVVQIGAGLNFESQGSNDKEDIATIGEFINSDKKISSLAKKKRKNVEHQQRNTIYRISKDDTKAMVALKHRMRKTQKEKVSEELQKRTKASTTSVSNDDSDSDEDEPRIEKTSKKTFGLLFNGKGNKKKK